MCPHHLFFDQWQNAHMDFTLFQRIPFSAFDFVHLQGWGEPLLHPKVLDFISYAAHFTRVGLTTNGILLEKLIPCLESLDYLAISVASAKEEKHKRLRKTSLKDILAQVKLIAQKSSRPKLVFATIMLTDTIEELPDLVLLAQECGVDEVIANNLDYIPSRELAEKAVFLRETNTKYSKFVEKAQETAQKTGVKLVVKNCKPEEVLVCAENPTNSCFVTVEGKISPCVYLHLPTKESHIPRFFNGNELLVPKVYFGSLKDEPFEKIWHKKVYRDFRLTFERREQALYQSLVLEIPELPSPCRTCYKAFGV